MTKIAFLGTGAMGSRMATKLMDAGHDLTIWNRSLERTQPLAGGGATIAQTPRKAVVEADVVFSMVRDDDASSAVWLDEYDGALAFLKPDAIGVECSTLSLEHIRKLGNEFERAGRALLDAPVAGSRPQVEAGQLIFFVGGAVDALQKTRPLLELLGGAVHHAGESGAGTTIKLMVNALFGTQLAVMAELIGFARKAGVEVEKAIEILGTTPVCSPAAKISAMAMLAGNYAPAFPIDLVVKDFNLITQTASNLSAQTPVSNTAGAVYEKGITKGFGDDNITGIVQIYEKIFDLP